LSSLLNSKLEVNLANIKAELVEVRNLLLSQVSGFKLCVLGKPIAGRIGLLVENRDSLSFFILVGPINDELSFPGELDVVTGNEVENREQAMLAINNFRSDSWPPNFVGRV